MNFDVIENWKLVQQCAKEVLQRSNISPSSIQAISATSMREGFVLYDKMGKKFGLAQMLMGVHPLKLLS